MSDIFNLSHLFTESTSYNVLANPVSGELYMSSVIESLESFNESIFRNLQALHEELETTENREEENNVFCKYFDQVDKDIQKIINKIQQMTSRFIINAENIVDSNKDILNNTDIISNCKPFVYNFIKYKRINDSNFPVMNPMELFHKEFDYIGQLLQELGPAASNQTKLKMIATVYNKLNNSSVDLNKKCVEMMLGEEIDNVSKFPKKLYEMFKEDTEEKNIDKGLLYNLKMSLENYQNVVGSCTNSANDLIRQFSCISDKIRVIICGNEKNKLKIESNTDGIRNTEYKLDTYSMNQVDLFLKTKINQVVQMANIYYIALAIKLDCTMDYFKQCKDILAKAELSCEDQIPSDASQDAEDNVEDITTEEPPVEGEENTEEPETPEEVETEDSEDDDDKEDDEDSEDDDDKEDDDDSDEDESEEESKDENSEEQETPEIPEDDEPVNDIDNDVKDFEESVRLFDHDLFSLITIGECFNTMERLTSFVNEAEDDKSSDNDGDSTKVGKSSTDNTEAKISIWKKIVQALAKLWDKFAAVFKNKIEVRIKWLNENKRYIAMPVDSHVNDSGSPVMHEIKVANFDALVIPDLNIKEMESIEDEDAFIKKYFSKIDIEKDLSFKESMMKMVVNEDENAGVKDTKDINIPLLFEWCTKEYMNVMKDIESMNNKIEDASKKAESEAKKQSTGESTFERSFASYFTELGIEKSADEKKEVSNSKKIDMYFKLCSQVITAKESLVNKVFNEYYSILKWHINKKKK